MISDQQWKEEFFKERFSWSSWHSQEGFRSFKALLKEQGASFSTWTKNSGKCIDCEAGVDVTCLSVRVKLDEPVLNPTYGWYDTHAYVDLMEYRDRCFCE